MKFRITTVLWVFAMLASAMATFGNSGVVPALIVIFFWWLVSKRRQGSLWEWLGILAITFFLAALLLPALQTARESHPQYSCINNLRQIGIGIHLREDEYKTLPPAFLVDDEGQRLHSWRYLLLPQLEYTSLYKQIRRDEPWNSPANKPLTDMELDWMQCPNGRGKTSYFAVVGPQTAWPGSRGLKLSEIKDNPSQTILLIEAGGRDIGWAEPQDLNIDEALEILTQPANPQAGDGNWVENGFFYLPSASRNLLFADTRIRSLHGPLSQKTARALLTIDGGEEIDWNEFNSKFQPKLNYARIYSLSVFVLLSILPFTKLDPRLGPIKNAPTEEATGS